MGFHCLSRLHAISMQAKQWYETNADWKTNRTNTDGLANDDQQVLVTTSPSSPFRDRSLLASSSFGACSGTSCATNSVIHNQSIASGLIFVDLSASVRFTITGEVLSIAVITASETRKETATHGHACAAAQKPQE